MIERVGGESRPPRTITDIQADAAIIKATDGEDPRFARLMASHLEDGLVIATALRNQEIDVFTGADLIATQRAKAEKDGIIDPMTGLYTKVAFEFRLESELARARRDKSPTAIAYLDLDDFSMVNNEESHEHGHTVLSVLGNILRSDVRASDLIGRCGGEEIVVALPNATEEQAKSRLDQIREDLPDKVNQGIVEHGFTLEKRITASIGIAEVQFTDPFAGGPTSIDMRKLLEIGDQRMRMAKIMGKNRIVGSEEEKQFRNNPALMEIGRQGKYRIH